MDTYPSEFISHHVPLMFVAGLNPVPQPRPPPTNGSSGAPPTAAQPGDAPSLPTNQAHTPDPFATLVANLRATLAARKSWVVWDNSRGANSDFHVIPVDKNVRFPPLKARPAPPPGSAQQQQPGQPIQPPSNAALHSPISPLTPTSPLYPDGIMAPIWIRKHREMTPAVFVLVLRLAEIDHSSKLTRTLVDPLVDQNAHRNDASDVDADATELDEERRLDAQLVNEIVDRKRSTVERGIKLAVVLLCSRRLLDNPSLDNRLSLIRRQSGLDARASLFVISPVPQSEVVNFVASLKAELYPAALDFYREHGRRVRRKRARQVPKGGLSDKGWSIRYDYKMGFFSEMRGEIEVALKHYEDCYDSLIDMFAHVETLPPRTKRWAEAKVLTDCLSVKVSKMYLYLNETARAVAQLNRHVARFRELSNGWGLGEQTFEFWSWLSKQYRLFGDLVATALRAGFRLPAVRPTAAIQPPVPGQPTPALVPSNVLQHPGFYYFSAATASVERRNRFKHVKKAISSKTTENGEPVPVPASIMHESKIDHSELIIDLFTKAYEFFKHHKMRNMTVFVASQIAKAHFESDNRDMAIKFNDRISKSFRRDHWNAVLQSILRQSVELAVRSEDEELAIRSILELLSPNSTLTGEEREEYAERLQGILAQDPRSKPELLSIDMTDACALCNRLQVYFANEDAIFVVSHDDAQPREANEGIIRIAEQSEAASTRLQWPDGSSKVFAGYLMPLKEGPTTVDRVVMAADWNGRQVELVMKPLPATLWHTKAGKLQIQHINPIVCDISARKLDIQASVDHKGPAYIGESFPFDVVIENLDCVDAEVSLDLLLQPGEDDSPNILHADDQSSTSFIRGVSLGTVSAGAKARKQCTLDCVGTPGGRSLDISVRARPISTPAVNGSSPTGHLLPSAVEILHSASIPALHPVTCAFDSRTLRKRRKVKQLLDMQPPDGWEGASQVHVVAKLHASGPEDIEVTGLTVVNKGPSRVRIMQSSLDILPSPLNLRWSRGDLFVVLLTLEVASGDGGFPSCSLELSWRRAGHDTASSRANFVLPPLVAPPPEPTVSLRLPPYVKLHTPVTLKYHFSNPTMDVLRMYISFDSAPTPGTFVFAGPRREPNFILVPDEERDLSITVIPLALGHFGLPRMRVFLQETVIADNLAAADSSNNPNLDGQTTRSTELVVVAEHDEYVESLGANGQEPTTPQPRTSLESASGGGQPSMNVAGTSSVAMPNEFRVTVLP
ncbi:hypothetical protein OIV83_000729 [Microbotryomycetes sp. JL201]|nr:hypothetical protein OIV83_000729 [Microbotryomycetes sp. JL201]